MTYEQFWNGDPYLAVYYRQAYKLRLKGRNQELWLQGVYNYKAFECVMQEVLYAIGGRKGKKPEGYLKEPFDILPKTQEEKEAEVERQRKKIIDALSSWKKQWESKK